LAVSSPALTQAGLRKVLLMFAVTLGIAGAWILISEFARPSRIGFPVHHNDLDADQRAKASRAAHVGLVRGDLWAELFFSFSGRDFGPTLNEAVLAAQRALAYAPYRTEVWLLLADMAEKYQLPNPKSGAALTMSYYTAPYNWTLAPLRLSVAARGDALTDPELQQFVERDLRTILAGKPELRNAVRAAYVTASAPSRRFFESVVQQADPRFMTSLKQMN